MAVSDPNAAPRRRKDLPRERSHAKLVATSRQRADAAQAVCSTHRVPRQIGRDLKPQ